MDLCVWVCIGRMFECQTHTQPELFSVHQPYICTVHRRLFAVDFLEGILCMTSFFRLFGSNHQCVGARMRIISYGCVIHHFVYVLRFDAFDCIAAIKWAFVCWVHHSLQLHSISSCVILLTCRLSIHVLTQSYWFQAKPGTSTFSI